METCRKAAAGAAAGVVQNGGSGWSRFPQFLKECVRTVGLFAG